MVCAAALSFLCACKLCVYIYIYVCVCVCVWVCLRVHRGPAGARQPVARAIHSPMLYIRQTKELSPKCKGENPMLSCLVSFCKGSRPLKAYKLLNSVCPMHSTLSSSDVADLLNEYTINIQHKFSLHDKAHSHTHTSPASSCDRKEHTYRNSHEWASIPKAKSMSVGRQNAMTRKSHQLCFFDSSLF